MQFWALQLTDELQELTLKQDKQLWMLTEISCGHKHTVVSLFKYFYLVTMSSSVRCTDSQVLVQKYLMLSWLLTTNYVVPVCDAGYLAALWRFPKKREREVPPEITWDFDLKLCSICCHEQWSEKGQAVQQRDWSVHFHLRTYPCSTLFSFRSAYLDSVFLWESTTVYGHHLRKHVPALTFS